MDLDPEKLGYIVATAGSVLWGAFMALRARRAKAREAARQAEEQEEREALEAEERAKEEARLEAERAREAARADYQRDVIFTHRAISSAAQIVALPFVQRFLLIRSHNGGDRPSIGKPQKVTIEYEDVATTERRIREEFQSRVVDPNYTLHILTPIANEEMHIIHVSSLEEGSMLRDLYEADRVVATLLGQVIIDPEKQETWFIAINVSEWPDTEERQATLRTMARDAMAACALSLTG